MIEIRGGNIFIDRGDEIYILHSSRALGMAAYEEANGTWA